MWIPLSEKEPEMEVDVLLWAENKHVEKKEDDPKGWVQMGFLNSKKISKSGIYLEWMDDSYEEIYNVTHWQPLPEAP